MAETYGGFSLPTPNRTSQLTNDSQYTSARDYIVDYEDTAAGTDLEISDLTPGTVIYKVEINVSTAFNTSAQGNLGMYGDSDAVIVDPSWCDPNEVGNYVNSCYYQVTNTHKVTLKHNLSSASAGVAVVRLFIYETES